MSRFDSFGRATWNDGTKLTGLQADGTTIVNVTALVAGFYLVGVSGSCDVIWNYNFIHYQPDGSTVRHQQLRQVTVAGNEDWIFPSPWQVFDGDSFVIKLVGAVAPVTGLQMSIFPTLMA